MMASPSCNFALDFQTRYSCDLCQHKLPVAWTMLTFILYNLLLAVLVQSQSEFLPLLTTPVALGIGLFAMAASLLAGYLKKVPTMAWHDGFATGSLLVWYAYWQPQFGNDAPMFFFYPVYFALLTAIVTLALINKSPYFDLESVEYLRGLEKITRFDMSVVISFVLISLLIYRHYSLYPMAITFFVVRHTMIICLETIDRWSRTDHYQVALPNKLG